ncbi:hypothetical protein GN330_00220 [Nitratireductor sp. CAU 1489]|uniref:DUF6460 domain-containing protein n=1 Tax=Nitratireductor arenosus TaxID=2682096 RepID=A0A844Q6K3_9HYPH|nr:hypothetical protein [Nitratireductor arenosus]
MAGRVTRILGDSPVRLVLKLVVVSFLVGIIMDAFGWSALAVWIEVRDVVLDVWHMGFSALGRFADHILLGAAVVVPAFIILRLLSVRR